MLSTVLAFHEIHIVNGILIVVLFAYFMPQCALQPHFHAKLSRKPEPVYVGSFGIQLEPWALAELESLVNHLDKNKQLKLAKLVGSFFLYKLKLLVSPFSLPQNKSSLCSLRETNIN